MTEFTMLDALDPMLDAAHTSPGHTFADARKNIGERKSIESQTIGAS